MSRYLKDLEKRKSKIIHIYRNGDPYSRATFIILRLIEQMELERVIRAIEEKVCLQQNRAILKLFDMQGNLITNALEIEDGKYYVAASTEPFQNVEYGHTPNWVRIGPLRTDKYANVKYISRREEEGKLPYSRLSTSNSAIPRTITSELSKPKPKTSTGAKKPRNVKSLKKKDRDEPIMMNKMSASEHIDSTPVDQMITDPVEEIKADPTPIEDEINHEQVPNEEPQPDELEHQNHFDPEPNTEEEIKDIIPESNKMEENPTPSDEPEEHQNEMPVEPDQVETQPNNDHNEDKIQNHTEEQEQEQHSESEFQSNKDEDNDDNEMCRNAAATKIQANFRGYKVRSTMDRVRDDKLPNDSLDDMTEPNDDNSQDMENY